MNRCTQTVLVGSSLLALAVGLDNTALAQDADSDFYELSSPFESVSPPWIRVSDSEIAKLIDLLGPKTPVYEPPIEMPSLPEYFPPPDYLPPGDDGETLIDGLEKLGKHLGDHYELDKYKDALEEEYPWKEYIPELVGVGIGIGGMVIIGDSEGWWEKEDAIAPLVGIPLDFDLAKMKLGEHTELTFPVEGEFDYDEQTGEFTLGVKLEHGDEEASGNAPIIGAELMIGLFVDDEGVSLIDVHHSDEFMPYEGMLLFRLTLER